MRGSQESSFSHPDSVISRDVEGLTIYYAASGTRYLIASSQGGAPGEEPTTPDALYDDSFAVFSIEDSPDRLGASRVGASEAIDAVQESDGAEVTSVALPGFPNGHFITQEGYMGDLDGSSRETARTGFKLVDWQAIARSFDPPLEGTPSRWNPRG